jgi:hypothetical protein
VQDNAEDLSKLKALLHQKGPWHGRALNLEPMQQHEDKQTPDAIRL